MGRISTAGVRFPARSGAKLAARLDLPTGAGRRTPSRCSRTASPARRTPGPRRSSRRRSPTQGHRDAALRLHGPRRLRRRVREHRFFVERRRPRRGGALARDEITGAPSLLVGHSLGGAAVLAAAAQIPSARAVATINAPSDPAHLGKLFAGREDEIAGRGEAEVDLAGRRFTIRREFLDDIAMQKIAAAVAGCIGRCSSCTRPRTRRCRSITRRRSSWRGEASEELRLARHRGPSPDAARGCALRGDGARRVGDALSADDDAATEATTAPRDTVIVRETKPGKFQQRITDRSAPADRRRAVATSAAWTAARRPTISCSRVSARARR